MLGFIFFEFKQYIIKKHGSEVWQLLAEKTHIPSQQSYKNNEPYPDEQLLALIGQAAVETGQTAAAIEEDFGVFSAPFLVRVSSHMISPQWGLMDLLLHTQTVIHTRLAKSMEKSTTPFLDIKQDGPNDLIIVYRSPRRMCSFAKGLLKGLSNVYHTPISIEEPSCMHKGDSQCVLRVHVDEPNQART